MFRQRALILLLFFLLLWPLVVAAAPVSSGPPDSNPDLLHAVELARQGNSAEALPILKRLVDTYPAEDVYAYNYLVVLGWAGRASEALELYDNRLKANAANLPGWVRYAAGGAYYQAGRYPEALEIFSALVKAGDPISRVNEAETLIQLGRDAEGDATFDTLLSQATPGSEEAVNLLIRRAAAHERRGDYAQAADLYIAAHKALSGGKADPVLLKRISALIVQSLIRANNYGEVDRWAAPYLKGPDKDAHIQGNVILAHRLAGQHKRVIQEAKDMWPTYDGVPPFGLQALGDSFFLQGDYKQAIALYDKVLKIDPTEYWAKLARGFALVSVGKVDNGLQDYNDVLAARPALVNVAINDCVALLGRGRPEGAKRLFQVVTSYSGQNLQIRRKYADTLLAGNMPRAAYAQYEIIAGLPDGRIPGKVGMARAALAVGDGELAKSIIAEIKGDSLKNPYVAQALGELEGRNRGNIQASTTLSQDHFQQEQLTFRVSADQYLSDSLKSSTGVGFTRVSDKSTGDSAVERSVELGLIRPYMNSVVRARWIGYGGAENMNGVAVSIDQNFGDRTVLSLGVTRAPQLDSESLQQGIRYNNYNLTFTRNIGDKDTLWAGLGRSYYSDSNVAGDYSFNWDHTFYQDTLRMYTYGLTWSYLGYRYQAIDGVDTPYDSPSNRRQLGPTLGLRWTYPSHYWQLSSALGWQKDMPEGYQFSPWLRLEYGLTIAENRTLTIAAEYGFNGANGGSSFSYGSRLYEITYTASW